MAKFDLEEGEYTLGTCRVTARLDRRHVDHAAQLVLTNERVVLCTSSDTRLLEGFFGLLGSLFSRALDAEPGEAVQQIAREELASAEVDGDLLVIRSSGEGYARTTITVQLKDAGSWPQRLERWAAGEDPGEPLPPARVVRGGK